MTKKIFVKRLKAENLKFSKLQFRLTGRVRKQIRMTMNLPQEKKITRRDVAKYAGVSVATVSYVLGNHPGIKIRPETRARVLHAAQVLNYRPSYIGTALTTRRSFNIGVLFRTLHHLNYHFYREILISAGNSMVPESYHLLLFFRSSGFVIVSSLGFNGF